jgi:hypothetical protein
MQNTPMPTDGLMVGGGPPPERPAAPDHDPWAVPTPAENVIPVGGKIRMGLTGKKKDS